MKLRVILATPSREVGGVSRAVLDLAEGMQRRGHAILVAIPADAPEVRAAITARGVSSIGLHRSARMRSDIWHLHLNDSLDTSLLGLIAKRRSVPGAVILTEHLPRMFRTDSSLSLDPTIPHGQRKPGAQVGKTVFKRAEFELADQVLTPGVASADFLARRYGVRRSAIQTIHNGVAAPDEPPEPPPGQPMEVIIVGMLAHRKGHDVLLDACARARERWNVTCLGEGALRGSLEAAARRIEDREIRFVGWHADARTAPLTAHVACVPSRMESFPYAALEAMACARPVVASRIDGLAEIVDDGKTGLLVPCEDPKALAAALDRLATDAGLRRHLGTAAHAVAQAKFGIDKMVERTLELYVRLLSPKQRPQPPATRGGSSAMSAVANSATRS